MPEITELAIAEPAVDLAADVRTQYAVTLEQIAEVSKTYALLQANTSAGYRDVQLALRDCVGKRTGIDKTRKKLKAPALAFNKEVEAVANELKAAVVAIEGPLSEKKAAVDEVKAAEKEARAKAKRDAEKAAAAAELAEEAARLKTIRDTEEANLAVKREAQRIEAARLAALADKLEAEAAEAQAKLAKERAELAAEKKAADEKAAAAAAGLARVEAEKAEAERVAAMAPDLEKLKDFGHRIHALVSNAPEVTSHEAQDILAAAVSDMEAVARGLCGDA